MQAHPTSSPESVAATEITVTAGNTSSPGMLAAKAHTKALKKIRKHENKRLFFGWCSCLHALGFSF